MKNLNEWGQVDDISGTDLNVKYFSISRLQNEFKDCWLLIFHSFLMLRLTLSGKTFLTRGKRRCYFTGNTVYQQPGTKRI
jgi:hypothetical protein